MDIKLIKAEANQLTKKNISKLFLICLFVQFVLLSIQLISNQIIAIFLGIASVTISHAYVFGALKVVKGDGDNISFKDCFIGIKDFARLFPSYIMRKVTLNVISILILLPAIIIIRFRTGFALGEFLDWMRMIVVSGVDDLAGISGISQYLSSHAMILSLFISMIITSIFSYGFAMIPYLVEEYDISWNEAMVKSWEMMKGHKMELLYLNVLYLPRMLMAFILFQLITQTFAFSTFFLLLFSLLASIYLPLIFYLPHIEVATAKFYAELMEKQQQVDLFKL